MFPILASENIQLVFFLLGSFCSKIIAPRIQEIQQLLAVAEDDGLKFKHYPPPQTNKSQQVGGKSETSYILSFWEQILIYLTKREKESQRLKSTLGRGYVCCQEANVITFLWILNDMTWWHDEIWNTSMGCTKTAQPVISLKNLGSPKNLPRVGLIYITHGSLTVRPEFLPSPNPKERIVFQRSFFRGKLLNFGGVHQSPPNPPQTATIGKDSIHKQVVSRARVHAMLEILP